MTLLVITHIISVNNDIVGVIGKVHPKVSEDDIYALEINLDKLLAKKVGKMKLLPYLRRYSSPAWEILSLETECFCTVSGTTDGYGYNDDYDEME